MTLRSRLWIAQAPLALALAMAGIVAVAILQSLGESSGSLLADNYRSVLAAERMKEAVEGMDRGVLLVVAGERDRGLEQIAASQALFDRELRFQEGNITEEGEREATARLRSDGERYRRSVARFAVPSEPGALRTAYFEEVLPHFTDAKASADEILAMNQLAMVRRSATAGEAARRSRVILASIAVIGFALGAFASARITSRILRPLWVLREATRSIAQGDLRTSIPIHGQDEIAQVAAEFNAMAERLRRYRESSLGELLVAQSAAQAAIDSLPDPIVILSMDGHLLHANQAARAFPSFAGLPSGDPVAGMEPALRERLRTIHRHVVGGRGAYTPASLDEALRISDPAGDRYFLPRGTPLHRDEGDVAGAAIVLQDVTRLLRFHQLKDDLVSTVAHELRTPLTSLRMAVHLCIERAVGPLTEKQEDLLYAARDDCERLQGIIEDLLDVSRLRDGRAELNSQEVDVEGLVRSAIAAVVGLALERCVRIKSEILPGTGTVQADPERLGLVLSNLLRNAILHSPADEEVAVRAGAAGSAMRVEVLDRGRGVPEERREAIFEKHVRGEGEPEGGSGLGLFIAREIVTAHAGAIGVSAREGGGSTFWMTIPMSAPERARHTP